MLAIAGAVTWLGYGLFVYGFSQVRSQNYSIGQLLIPGRFVPGVPPDSPGAGGGGLTPCTAAQTAAGWTMSNAGCIAPSASNAGTPGNPNPTGCPTGYHKNSKGKCVQAYR